MSKLTKTFENGKIKSTLTFRGVAFNVTMGEWDDGKRESEEKCLENQLKETFSADEKVRDFLDDYDVDALDGEDEDDIEEILELLSQIE